MSRWHRKADALYTAWVQTVHSPPNSSEALRLALAVAQHETRCGDAWPGEHNWGAVQKRGLSPVEQEILSRDGIVVDPKGTRADAAAACKLAAARLKQASDDGEIWELYEEALHVDSSPIRGLYMTWFWAFDNDIDGAKQFLRVLILKMPKVRTVMVGKPTAAMLAAAMYEHNYYEGFNDPRAEGGKQANIDAYAKEISYHAALITTALTDWQPPEVPAPSEMERSITTVRGQRRALNYLGYGRPFLDEDTDAVDRKFTAVVGFFQGANDDISDRPLQVDGDPGSKTQLALLRAIATFDALKRKGEGHV